MTFGYILKNIGTKLIFLKTKVLNWILTPNIGTNKVIKCNYNITTNLFCVVVRSVMFTQT